MCRLFFAAVILLLISCGTSTDTKKCPVLKVSDNGRYLATDSGDPFFWLGDTGWMLFSKLSREEAEIYLENRRQKEFNIIQVMVLQNVRNAVNDYGDSALVNCDASNPVVTPGNSSDNEDGYDFWDHIDYITDLAHEKGMYMALVPVWGSNVKRGLVTREKAGKYAV